METLAERIAAQQAPLRQASLCLLVRGDEILLARKKRGFGLGKWNGVGGKPEPGEAILATTIRETEEEIGVTPQRLQRVATLDFFFPALPTFADWDQQVCVYLATAWSGEPHETEEVAPRWFQRQAIPYAEMWVDDPYWLPLILQGKTLYGQFLYASADRIQEYQLTEGIAEPDASALT